MPLDLPSNPGSFASREPFVTERIHAAAVYCSDGRFGEQFDDFLHNALSLPRYDRLAIPGGPACLAGHFNAYRQEDGLVEHLKFLVDVHRLQRVVLIAHQGCAFYLNYLRVHEIDLLSRQCDDMVKAVQRVRGVGRGLDVDAYFALTQGPRVVFRTLQDLVLEINARRRRGR